MDRGEILARGQSWVDQRVPYSAAGTHDGYSQGSGGFVSMAWKTSQPGWPPSAFGQIADNIGKDDLQPGDAMNC